MSTRAVFFEIMPTAIRQSEWKISSIILKKIASIGVWGNGRFPQLNLPSALAVAKQVCSFLFAYRIVDLYFVVLANEKLYSCGQIWFLRMPYCSCEMWFLYFIKMLCGNVIASSKNNENSFLVRWQKLEVRVFFFICLLGCSDWFSWLLDACT